MRRNQVKFVLGAAAIVGVLGYLAMSGFTANMSYSQTIPELMESGEAAYARRLNVTGEVVPNSIMREGQAVKFVIASKLDTKGNAEGHTVPVRYVSRDPLPDTFHDRSTATVQGKYGKDGVFLADGVTAKCASKYEKEMAAGVVLSGQPTEPDGKGY